MTTPTVLPAPGPDRDLLFVSDVSPYRSQGGAQTPAGVHRSLGSAAHAFEQIASLCHLGYQWARRAIDISTASLERARVLVLFTIGETPWSAEQRQIIEDRVMAGELGLVGVHSASDSAYGWARFGDLLGGRFNGHPVTGQLSVRVLDDQHPATAHLPSLWRFTEELYVFRELSPHAHLLLGVELSPARPGAEPQTLPLSWCIQDGNVRTFYTVFGHFLEAYEDGAYLQHLRGAVEWVISERLA